MKANVSFAIGLGREYVKAQKLKFFTLESLWESAYFEVIKWLHKYQIGGCTPWSMDYAAGTSNLELVKWFQLDRSEGCSEWAMQFAAKNGHLEVVKWLYKTRDEGCSMWAINRAAENGHLKVVQWPHSSYDWAIECAAGTGI